MLDVSFIKAWSILHLVDNKKELSDDEARVERAGRSYGLGYNLHLLHFFAIIESKHFHDPEARWLVP